MRLATLDAWNFTVQHQLSSGLSVEAGYVGNKGTHMFAGEGPTYDFNAPTVAGFAQGLSTDERRPFFSKFGWTQGFRYFGNDADTRYNSLQTKVEKRFSQSYSLLAHYTWSKALNYDQDYFAIQPHYGLVDFNRKHVFLVNSVYELPFGRGKPYMSNVSRLMENVVKRFLDPQPLA